MRLPVDEVMHLHEVNTLDLQQGKRPLHLSDAGLTPARPNLGSASAAVEASAVTRKPAATAPALASQGFKSGPPCPERQAKRPACASGSRARRERVRSKRRHAWRQR